MRCSSCKETKDPSEFYRNSTRKTGFAHKCKICTEKWNKENKSVLALAKKRGHLKSRYGITLEEYEGLLRKQDGRCAICKWPFTRTPHVDHSHRTGRVRGLLCRECNLAIGNALDNIDILKSAIKYLKEEFLNAQGNNNTDHTA